MPRETVTVCARCQGEACDGGVWRVVKAERCPPPPWRRDERVQEWRDETRTLTLRPACTWRTFGTDAAKVAGAAVGHELVETVPDGRGGAVRLTIRKEEA